MKKVKILLIIIFSLLIGSVVGYILCDKEIIGFKKKEVKEVKKDDQIKIVGKKYMLNYNEYILFKYDNTYERKRLDYTKNAYEIKTGKYVYENDSIIFDGVLKAKVFKDYILLYEENKNYNVNKYAYPIFFSEDSLISVFNSFTEEIKKDVVNRKQETDANVSYVTTDIEECFVKSDNLDNIVCNTHYNVYFYSDENYTKEECETENSKFMNYSISSGYCDYDHVFNFSFYEFDKNYNLVSSYTGL